MRVSFSLTLGLVDQPDIKNKPRWRNPPGYWPPIKDVGAEKLHGNIPKGHWQAANWYVLYILWLRRSLYTLIKCLPISLTQKMKVALVLSAFGLLFLEENRKRRSKNEGGTALNG